MANTLKVIADREVLVGPDDRAGRIETELEHHELVIGRQGDDLVRALDVDHPQEGARPVVGIQNSTRLEAEPVLHLASVARRDAQVRSLDLVDVRNGPRVRLRRRCVHYLLRVIGH